MNTDTFTLCSWVLFAGLVSACGSGNDTTSPINTQVMVAADSSSTDASVNGSTEETVGQTIEVESDPAQLVIVETGESVTQEASDNSGEDSTDPGFANPQNEGQHTNTDSQTDSQEQQTNPETAGSDDEQPVADNQRVNFGPAKLLVDLVPNGGSYPAKFHRIGDKLYFWTVDTDPSFARCLYHWGNLSDSDKSVSFNLVNAHPETGVVAMNKQMMILGDFAENANSACAGYNGSVMEVYEQTWMPASASGEHQFILQFNGFGLGPDRVWTTDGSEANTSLVETGQMREQTIFEGNKVFFVSSDGLSVSNTLAGDRRKLFEKDNQRYYGPISQIARSSAGQVTFEIGVGPDRFQVWTYDLDTDEWVKKFNIKPDNNIYIHNETLLVDGNTLLSRGENISEGKSALGISRTTGDVTSFEIISDSAPSLDDSNGDNIDQVTFSTTEFSVDPKVTSIWSYRDERIEKLFSISEPGLENKRVIAGQDGNIYFAGTRNLNQWPKYDMSLDLWSYDRQTRQLVKLSNSDWYAVITDHPTPDENYTFRYLNTPDGLIFVNLKEDSGRELWSTDGTREGTRLLADINPGPSNSDPRNFYYSGDAIYFSANDGTHDHEPWMIPISR